MYVYDNAVKKLLAAQTVALWHTWLILSDDDNKTQKFSERVLAAAGGMAEQLFGAQRGVIEQRVDRKAYLTSAAAANLQHMYEMLPVKYHPMPKGTLEWRNEKSKENQKLK